MVSASNETLCLISVSSGTHIDDGYSIEMALTPDQEDFLAHVFGKLADERARYDQPRSNPRALVRFGDPLPLPEDH